MEKVAIAFRAKHNRPLVLAINNIHHTPQNDAGFALLLQLQQRAESWAQAGVVTVVSHPRYDRLGSARLVLNQLWCGCRSSTAMTTGSSRR